MHAVDRSPIGYRDPWTLPLAERIDRIRSRPHRIAWLMEAPDWGTFRYRAWNMAELLAARHPEVGTAWFYADEIEQLAALAPLLRTLVIVRSRYTWAIDDLVSRVHRHGGEVVFDIDDLILDPAVIPVFLRTTGYDRDDEAAWTHWFGYAARLQATFRLADRAIASTAPLAAEMARIHPVRVDHLPNHLDPPQLAISERVWREKEAAGFAGDGAIHLGYFSGTRSHDRDLALATDALARLFDEMDDLRLVLVGDVEPTGPLLRHADRIMRVPRTDFVHLQAWMGAVELNLVPLQHDRFTVCKSPLKVFEAGAVGTPSIASPGSTAAAEVARSGAGWIAHGEDWEPVLRAAVAVARDREGTYAAIARRAREATLAAWSPDAIGPLADRIYLGG